MDVVLDLNFLTAQATSMTTMPAGCSLVRAATGAGRFNWGSDGNLASSALGESSALAPKPCYEWGKYMPLIGGWANTFAAQGIWLEPAFTQQLLQSNALATTWSVLAGSRGTGKADPMGGTSGWSLTNGVLYQAKALGAATYTLVLLLKSADETATRGMQLRLTDNNGTAKATASIVNLVKTLAENHYYDQDSGSGWTINGYRLHPKGSSGWWQAEFTATAVGYNLANVKFDSRVADNGEILLYYAGLFLTAGPVPNPVYTTTATKVNNADVLTADMVVAELPALWTMVFEHDLADTGALLTSGGVVAISAPTTALANRRAAYTSPLPRRTVINSSGDGHDSIAGAFSVAAPSFSSTDLTFGLDTPFHLRRFTLYSGEAT